MENCKWCRLKVSLYAAEARFATLFAERAWRSAKAELIARSAAWATWDGKDEGLTLCAAMQEAEDAIPPSLKAARAAIKTYDTDPYFGSYATCSPFWGHWLSPLVEARAAMHGALRHPHDPEAAGQAALRAYERLIVAAPPPR